MNAEFGMRNVEDENREQNTADRRWEVEKVRRRRYLNAEFGMRKVEA